MLCSLLLTYNTAKKTMLLGAPFDCGDKTCEKKYSLALDDSKISHAQDWDQDWPPLDWICRPFLPIHKPHLRKRPPKSRSGTVG